MRYRVFSLLLDLDELAELDGLSRLFGINRAAILSFWEKDHGDGRSGGLREWVEAQLDAAGAPLDHPAIEMLCYPRMFGFVFNPLTVYFCSDAMGVLRTILYEVCNTFGERRTYVIGVGQGPGAVKHSCDKQLYVSPFVPMDCRYDFHIEPPGARVLVRIDESDADGLLLRAAFSGQRRVITASSLAHALFAYPLMTFKVVGAIHWEALKLWLKGVPFLRHHAAETRVATTVVPGRGHR